jgi:hypothetical protein
MLLPVLQLLAARRAESARDAGGRGGAGGALAAMPALPGYMRVVPRRRGEPEPGCEGWRVDAPAAEHGGAQAGAAVAPLQRSECFEPLNHTAGGHGAARRRAAGAGGRRDPCAPRTHTGRLPVGARRRGTA